MLGEVVKDILISIELSNIGESNHVSLDDFKSHISQSIRDKIKAAGLEGFSSYLDFAVKTRVESIVSQRAEEKGVKAAMEKLTETARIMSDLHEQLNKANKEEVCLPLYVRRRKISQLDDEFAQARTTIDTISLRRKKRNIKAL